MTKSIHSILSLLLSALVLLFMTSIISLQNTAYAATVQPSTVTLNFIQAVEDEDLAANYRLIPVDPDNPMPAGSENGVYTFALKGESDSAVTISFTKPGTYEYQAGVYEDGEYLDTDATPLYQFGFQVTRGDNHTLNVQPYSCIDPYVGVGLDSVTLNYTLEKEVHPITAPDDDEDDVSEDNTNDFPAISTKKSATSTIKGAVVNTNDPANILFWICIMAFGLVGFFAIVLLKRRKDDEEEENA